MVRTSEMKRKGRPSLAENLAKQPLDSKQRTLACNFSLGLSPLPSASAAASASTTSAPKASTMSTLVSSPAEPLSSSALPQEIPESIGGNSSTACGYSELGSSVSASEMSYCDLERKVQRLEAQLERADRVVRTEVGFVWMT